MRKVYSHGIILGLALFAMFFGAGNLIFPTSVGLQAGDQWLPAMFGFLVTGVCLPLLGVFTVIKIGGTLKSFAMKLGKTPSMLYGILIITSLALVAVSRTAATTFEMSIAPLFPSVSPVISSIIFFLITWLLVFNPNGIIDRIGKILTPVLLLMLLIIIVKGVIHPIGTPFQNYSNNLFTTGFFGGYQTMDALGSVMLGGIITASLIQKGWHNKLDQRRVSTISILVAGLGLALVYGGLLYLGSTSSSILTEELSRTQLTISIVELILGNTGKVILGICVAFACLTTSVGLTAAVGDFYANLTNNKLKYKWIVTVTCLACAFIANFGVDAIVTIATPLLIAIYPLTILLMILNLTNASVNITKISIIGSLSVSIFDGLNVAGITFPALWRLIETLPFAEEGFAWILPAFIGGIIGLLIDLVQNTSKTKKHRAIKSV